MPNAPLRPCRTIGCRSLVGHGRPCPIHGERIAWQAKPETIPRLRGRANQRRRSALFAREPLCRECAMHGRVTIATIRDHIVPLAEGGGEGVDDNEQPLCQSCSDAKSREEAKRGSGRR